MKNFLIKLSPFFVGSLLLFTIISLSGSLFLPRAVFADEPAVVGEPFVQAPITEMDPYLIRHSQRTAGASSAWSKSVFLKMSAEKGEKVLGGVVMETVEGGGRVVGVKIAFPTDADALRALFYCKGFDKNFPVVVVELIDPATGEKYYVGFDNTRPAVAREVGMAKIPVRVYPENMIAPASVQPQRGGKLTWGEVVRLRMQGQPPEWYAAHPFGAEELERLAGTSIHEGYKGASCPAEPLPPPPTHPTPSCPSGISSIDEELARLVDALKKAQADHAELLASNETYVRKLKDLAAAKFGLTDDEFAALRAQIREAQENARQVVQGAEKALADAKARASAAGCASKPMVKSCPPGTKPVYRTIPENLDDIIKFYRGLSYGDALADIEHFLKTDPTTARRVAQALRKALDEEGAVLDAWNLSFGEDEFSRRSYARNTASDALEKLSSEIEKVKPATCLSEEAAALRAGKLFEQKAGGVVRDVLRKLTPTEIKEGVKKVKDFFTKGSWKGIRAQLFSKSNVAITVLASGVEVYIRAETIDTFLDAVENYNTQLNNAIRNIQQARARMERTRMSPNCTVKDPKDPNALNTQRDNIVAEIYHAFILAQTLDAASAKLVALYDSDTFKNGSKLNPLNWIIALEKLDWIGRLAGWRRGFGSETNFTEAVINLYPEVEGGACAEDEKCASLSLFVTCAVDNGGGGGTGGGGARRNGGGDAPTGVQVCVGHRYHDVARDRDDNVLYDGPVSPVFLPTGILTLFSSPVVNIGNCIFGAACCTEGSGGRCADTSPYKNVWRAQTADGSLTTVWSCDGLPRQLRTGECAQDFTAAELTAICSTPKAEWSQALRDKIQESGGSAGAPPTLPSQTRTTRSRNDVISSPAIRAAVEKFVRALLINAIPRMFAR